MNLTAIAFITLFVAGVGALGIYLVHKEKRQ
jgi:hypothetical protein